MGSRPRLRAYRDACVAARRASEARRDLPPGSSRAKVTSANARWMLAAEHRDRIADELRAAGLAPEADAIWQEVNRG